ncbi:hypothetical protein M501DRAFT_1014689 [Patellaria atrata CBS 101060]|uniref:Uncharacterized protein n=1 Tax=Patellaria atrata CBS 101060 TaxID=1346257 RepID=A0A9P4SDN6_9PEZI|nr:hypothetical protein M501DRAFT_1014689 [Patellaria atrata CBS 101060]
MKTMNSYMLLVALLSAMSVASMVSESFIPVPSDTTTEPTALPDLPSYYQHVRDIMSHTYEGMSEEEVHVQKRESCWERVDGICAPYCDDMYPGPDKAAKRNACAICVAVHSAFCLA